MGEYIHGHHDSVLRSHRWRTAANSAAYLLDHLRPGMSLLDVGCGPATLTADLARRVAPGRVVGVDAAAGVLAEAAATVAGIENAEVQAGDVHDLGFAPGSFDVVHAHQLLQHLVDPVAALREMKRVCHPEGIVAVRDADYGAMTWWPDDPWLGRWLDTYRAVAAANGVTADAGRRLLAWARGAGLEGIVSTASTWCFSTPEDRSWWGHLWAERVVVSTLAEQAVGLGRASTDDLAQMADAWHRWAERPDGWFAVLHGEIVARPG